MKSKLQSPAAAPDKPAAPAKYQAPLPPPLVAALFAEAGVALRAGRPEIISATLGPAVGRLRVLASRLAFECEPGLFPVTIENSSTKTKKKRTRR